MNKTKAIFIICLAILIIIFSGCSKQENYLESERQTSITVASSVENITKKETTETETTVKQSSNADTTTKPAEQKSAGQTTAKSTTAKQTTTQKATASTTKKQTTTKKVTTTQKKTTTTTKKVTTTSGYWCDEGGTHHSCDVGEIGWVSSYDEAQSKTLKYIADHNTSGSYRIKECFYCGKFTATVTLD